MIIHLIRHGATETSGKTYAGRDDVPLSTRGLAQAQRIAQDLAGCPLALILTSPLSRALHTAALLAAQHELEPIKHPMLLEFDFGIYAGRSKHDLDLQLRKTHASKPVQGGESLWDVWVRVGQVCKTLAALDLPSNSQIAIVGHFWINRLLFGKASGLAFDAACRARSYRPATGSVVLIDLPRAFVGGQDRRVDC